MNRHHWTRASGKWREKLAFDSIEQARFYKVRPDDWKYYTCRICSKVHISKKHERARH